MRWSKIIAVMCMLFFTISCQTPAGRTPGEVLDDTSITTTVKARMFEDPYLSGFAISVTTFKGVVTLTGAVSSEFEKNRATTLAKSVVGVRKVYNLLEIKR